VITHIVRMSHSLILRELSQDLGVVGCIFKTRKYIDK